MSRRHRDDPPRWQRRMAPDRSVPRARAHRAGERIPVDPDPSRIDLGNSRSPPPAFYEDQTFRCKDCGAEQTWSAPDQQWYHEEVGGLIWRRAVRCRPCRIRERIRRAEARRIHLDGLRRRTVTRRQGP